MHYGTQGVESAISNNNMYSSNVLYKNIDGFKIKLPVLSQNFMKLFKITHLRKITIMKLNLWCHCMCFFQGTFFCTWWTSKINTYPNICVYMLLGLHGDILVSCNLETI